MKLDVRIPENDDDLFAVVCARQSALLTFATAIARSHPAPDLLAAALELTISEDKEGDEPLNELTPANQLGRQYREAYEQMFLRIARNRAQSG